MKVGEIIEFHDTDEMAEVMVELCKHGIDTEFYRDAEGIKTTTLVITGACEPAKGYERIALD